MNEKCVMMQFTEVLRNNPNHAYDFISNNYWKMDKEELASVIKELLYALYHNTNEVEQEEILEDVGIELDDQYEDFYAEYAEYAERHIWNQA